MLGKIVAEIKIDGDLIFIFNEIAYILYTTIAIWNVRPGH